MGVKLSDAEFDEVVQDASDGHLDFTNFVKAMMAQSEFWQ
jgi:Ca2+-binding EF-hand superfamily protein